MCGEIFGKSTEHADIAAFGLALESGLCGIPVISGLASGIDSAAHQGAVSCGGLTAAVLGSGIDQIYPFHNRKLAENICALDGAVISEYPFWEKPLRYHFPERNRIISGLSRSVILVEAPERSGALITADFALEQGRDLFVHSIGVHDSLCRGTKRLAEEGAEVISSIKEILESWGWNAENCPELVFHSINTASGFKSLVSKEIYKQVIPYKRGWFERVP
jgi:DNA processing protein